MPPAVAPDTDDSTMPPAACPTRYQALIAWDREPLDLLKEHKVPWSVIAQMSAEGFATLADLANRWDSKADIVATAGTDLKFASGEGSFDNAKYRRALAGIKEAWTQANHIKDRRTQQTHTADNTDSALLMVGGQRESMERTYEVKVGKKPPMEEQGSDHFMGAFYKEANKGSLGCYTTQEIVSKVPDPHAFLSKVVNRKKNTQNIYVETEHEERANPRSWEAWKRQMMVFRTTMLMAIYANPHQTKLHIEKEVLDKFYDWMYGTDLAGREPPPNLNTMIHAERMAWRRITLNIHEGSTLDESIKEIQKNSLFWQSMVVDKCKSQTDWYSTDGQDRGRPKGKSRDTGSRWNTWEADSSYPPRGKGERFRSRTPQGYGAAIQYDYNNDGKDSKESTPKGKGGKHKDGKNDSPKGGKPGGKGTWASKDSTGKKYCWAYHQNKCTKGQGCWNSHKCPIITGKGKPCDKNHTVAQH